MSFTDVRKGWCAYLNQWQWEKFGTLTFKHLPKHKDAIRHTLTCDFLRPLALKAKLQIGAMCIFNTIQRDHCHILLLGDNRFGQTLARIPNDHISKIWNHGLTDIQSIWDEGAAGYFVNNISFHLPDQTETFEYNRRLLNRSRLLSYP